MYCNHYSLDYGVFFLFLSDRMRMTSMAPSIIMRPGVMGLAEYRYVYLMFVFVTGSIDSMSWLRKRMC